MRSLPSGTVTFLFTDIEGSTKLLQQHGDRYADLLAEHRRILRNAFSGRGGVEVDTQGDAFFVAFERASDGVLAAQHAQTELASGPIRVRMGLHTGEPLLTEEGYVGLDVHKGARIAAAGHGGQVLLSEATRRLVEADVKDLGAHRFKDLQAAERIFQLGQDEFPPLKSLNQTNLPVQPTPFLGRDGELAGVVDLLVRKDVRTVTLTGPGGSGKTRLGLQAAAEMVDDFPGGVSFVPLASLADPELLSGTIATALGLRETADATAEEMVVRHVGARRSLLLLDNFEQLLPAGATTVARISAAAPSLTFVITSRESLRIAGEHEYPVAPLVQDDAVGLFVQRARAVVPSLEFQDEDWDIIRKICARLDRLPLALELAAARLKVLPLPDLLSRLERRLPLLTGGARDAPERQRTLHATIAWSYDLLMETERQLFDRFSVFTGGASIDAVSDVCGADLDGIASLVDKSLIRKAEGSGDEARVEMLETIREFAQDRLDESPEADSIQRAHALYFLAAAERSEPLLMGSEQVKWLRRFENDHDNLRAALTWLLEDGEQERALQLAGDLWMFWYMHGHVTEGRRWLSLALEAAPSEPTVARAKALDGAGYLAGEQSDHVSRGLLEESLRCARVVGSPLPIAIAASHLSAHMDMEEGEEARALGEEAVSLARSVDDRYTLAVTLNNLGQVLLYQYKDPEGALRLIEESLAIRREIGDRSRIALSLVNVGYVALHRDDTARARELAEEALALATEIGDKRHVSFALGTLGWAALGEGAFEEAHRWFGESLAVAQDIGHRQNVVEMLTGMAGAAAARSDPMRAARLTGATAALEDAIGVQPSEIDVLPVLTRLLDRAKSQATVEEWNAAGREGSKMSLEEAIGYAMAGRPEPDA
jgi:predicted ATPase/Tfp pilus assembly protein PilF